MANTPANRPLQEEELQILRATFESYDADDNGHLSTDELLKLLSSLDVVVSNDEAISAIKSFDMDNDGALNCQEFLSLMTLLKNMSEIARTNSHPDSF